MKHCSMTTLIVAVIVALAIGVYAGKNMKEEEDYATCGDCIQNAAGSCQMSCRTRNGSENRPCTCPPSAKASAISGAFAKGIMRR